MKKNNSGITIVALVITIIVLLIIASISIYEGRKIIKKSKVQTLETNMLTIEAKAKAYAEEIESKVWPLQEGTEANQKDGKRKAEYQTKGMTETTVSTEALAQVSDEIKENPLAYLVTGDALTKMGLSEINKEEYIVILCKTNYKLMDIIYPNGIEYNNTKYYSLSILKTVLDSD